MQERYMHGSRGRIYLEVFIYTATGPTVNATMAIYPAAVFNAKMVIYTAAGPNAIMAIYTAAVFNTKNGYIDDCRANAKIAIYPAAVFNAKMVIFTIAGCRTQCKNG